MSDRTGAKSGPDSGHPDAAPTRPRLLVLLALLVLIEALGVLGVAVFLIVESIVTVPESYATAIALIVLVLIAGIWIAFIASGMFRVRPWSRGAGLTWQIMQLVLALACFQGILGSTSMGVLLAVLAVACILLIISPPVTAVLRRER